MRAVVQRVTRAEVRVQEERVGEIGTGFLVLLGIHKEDTDKDLQWLVDKIIHLRVFEDEQGLMNRSLTDVQGELLIVSQFTLHGDCRKGRRPSWHTAAPPERANDLYQRFIAACRQRGIVTASGRFQAMMDVSLTNSGPVTILLDSHKTF